MRPNAPESVLQYTTVECNDVLLLFGVKSMHLFYRAPESIASCLKTIHTTYVNYVTDTVKVKANLLS
jgi:hypothetical protein